ncbi:MAG: hypothetical protein ACWA40_03640 [Planktomarina sp.]
MTPDHLKVTRQFGYSLAKGGYDQWSDFKDTTLECMSEPERAALAFMALRSLSPDQIEATARAALQPADAPLPTFLAPMPEARFWASCAGPSECKAYAAAAYEAMPPRDQMAFRKYITEIEVPI